MSARADFLVEIGTEELPPKSLRDLELGFADGVRRGLAEADLAFKALVSHATPRRLAVHVTALAVEQPAQAIEKRGPPLRVAFDAEGRPTRAASAFAEGLGVGIEDLDRDETPKGAWLCYRTRQPGQPTATLLPGIVDAALAALPVARRMRWGAGEVEFVRPVHWVVMLLGESVVPGAVLGVESGRTTRGHRFHAPGPFDLCSPADYARVLLEEGKVITGFAARRDRVRELVATAAARVGGQPVEDDALLDEVTALVEWPVPVLGRFAERFLALPEEVLVATLQGHQRYFPLRGTGGRLLPHFVTLANIDSRDPDQVREGNERVVLPRLSDAEFFWQQDQRTTLEARCTPLASMVWQKGLGSLADKSARVAQLAEAVASAIGCPAVPAVRAAQLAKADLLSHLVGEFPELQGIVGGHLARVDGEPPAVATAIGEQYLPRHAGDRLPASPAGQALALADRLDTLAGIFALGKRPGGGKDPFALRRAALGLLRIIIENGLDVDLPALLARAVHLQPARMPAPDAIASDLHAFVIDRLRGWCLDGLSPQLGPGTISAAMFEAVRLRQPASPLDFHQRLRAVHAFTLLPEAESLAVANKRITNILRSAGEVPSLKVDPVRFEHGEERALHEAIQTAAGHHAAALAARDYTTALRRLAALRTPVDAFFEAVLVMADDPHLRANRLALLRGMHDMFLDIADLSCLSVA